MATTEFLEKLTQLLPKDRVFTDPVDCYAYAYDNSRNYHSPIAVVFPLNVEEVQAVIKLCNAHKIPVVPRGRGTGTAGGSVPEVGGVALSLERMNNILSIDPDNRMAIVEPGVLNQELQDAIKPVGFFWPPDPSSAAYCSIGGNLATCAAGPHAVKYGVARDHILGLKAVTGSGDIIKTGCYTSKGVVGYDLTRLLVGSEGTLAVICEATLKLTPLPKFTGGITAEFVDTGSCAKAIAAIMAQPYTPSALEFLDSGALTLIRSRHENLLPENARAYLMIEVDGSQQEIAEATTAILQACQVHGLIEAKPAHDTKALWAARKALSPLLKDIAPKKINEDIAVPVSHLPELLTGLEKLAAHYQIANVNFGHAGNGNIHVNLLVNPDNTDEMKRAYECLDEVFSLVLSLQGTLSGEHGVGMAKRPFVPREIDATTINLMKSLKLTFDPNNILNPGKLFP
ncbi:MAG: FAD-linked oxidase C-terminal domain-containing protein [Methylotenera sp.]|nr:FAD-linked oxidase C-terminal domain-containing protein [Methylotenera sp.]MDP1754031.1 FAD-linked oxidase C-terminal domain-containing protein [Methylotenera sp.]MDP1959898.1 FAD-linked oxidase C-terminal domain-containing protein [Methylotenera sp.]MDP3206893.1 FAD-linked oxidase C-terminal domain-containing protein [Methylotenera sp.]MDP3302801.1 FAD-linked oxidase C-terminal domain-containing protein [Methylotenera sp.]